MAKKQQSQNRPAWSKERTAALKRDEYKCSVCGWDEKRYLEVHHILPYADVFHNELWNLVTLCKECHDLVDPPWKYDLYTYKNRKDQSKFISSLMNILTSDEVNSVKYNQIMRWRLLKRNKVDKFAVRNIIRYFRYIEKQGFEVDIGIYVKGTGDAYLKWTISRKSEIFIPCDNKSR